MNKNRLNWNTTSAQDDKYLYITIMRDIRAYCARGYCDLLITMIRFSDLPSPLVNREFLALNPKDRVNHIIIDWSNLSSVEAAIMKVMRALHGVNHTTINFAAYNEALNEFTMYLQKQKKQ